MNHRHRNSPLIAGVGGFALVAALEITDAFRRSPQPLISSRHYAAGVLVSAVLVAVGTARQTGSADAGRAYVIGYRNGATATLDILAESESTVRPLAPRPVAPAVIRQLVAPAPIR